jgi:molybdopterin/thiamine biosynthesis adenylyltransferase
MVISVVGVGGTGSVIAQQLAHLGVENFVFVDHDLIEATNLNRLVGAEPGDIGSPKVRVAESQVKRIAPDAKVTSIQKSVLDSDAAHSLLGTDFIFCCTDTQASRAVVNQLAYQYLIPCIDMGVSITSGNGAIQRITGRVQLLSPGHACLTCQELLDSNIVRQEFMTPEQRAQDPYFIGEGEPQPAVISLNSTMSSLAITMFLAVAAELPSKARQLNYDALIGRIRASSATRYPTCVVCSKHGALGRGKEWPLPVRTVTHDDIPS